LRMHSVRSGAGPATSIRRNSLGGFGIMTGLS